jgi:ribosomal protein S27E
MGDRFWIKINCGGCGAENPSKEDYLVDPMENGVYFAPSSGFMDFTCRKCGKKNWIENHYKGRVVSEEELTQLYKENGFEEIE